MPDTAFASGADHIVPSADGLVELQRQQSLLKTGALQDAIFNSACFSSIATDERGVIQIFNVGAERMLGYTAAEVVNQVTPADISDPQEVIARAKALSLELSSPIAPGFEALVFKASRGIEDIYELTYIRKDGSRFPAIVSVTALRDAQDRIIGYLLIGTDNTARKRVEASHALLDQRLLARTADLQRFRTAMDATADSIMLVDRRSMRYVEVNATACAMLGYTREELLRMSPAEVNVNPPEVTESFYDGIIADAAREFQSQTRLRRRDGSEIAVEVHRQAQQSGDDWIIVCVLRDVTERNRAQAEIVQLNAGLEERVRLRTAQLDIANKELASFSYSLSHDLRTPLSAIDGFSAQLGTEVGAETLSERGKHYIARIRAGVTYMGQMIDAMLLLAQVSTEKPGWVPVDLSAMAQGALAGYQEREPARVVQLAVQAGIVAHGDPRLLALVLDNLLGNAWKFSSRRPLARISFSSANGADQRPVYAVHDNGAGFDTAYADKLFGTFQRLHNAAEFPGSGIGLATVRRIISRHGGRIWAESVEGEGASFFFTLGDEAPPA